MSTLFISDLHLDPARPEGLAGFAQFLSKHASQIQALYILGDLFEYWVGDHYSLSEYPTTVDQLRSLTKQGLPIYFMAGNRDFLIGKRFFERTGIQYLEDPTVINLYGTQTLLCHGDTLCTDDVRYQRFRKIVRNPFVQTVYRSLPCSWQLKITNNLRQTSTQEVKKKPVEIMDVNTKAVSSCFRDHRVTRIIHGHTHRPNIHQLTVDQTDCTRIVLGDWYTQGSVLRIDEKGYQLLDFDLPQVSLTAHTP